MYIFQIKKQEGCRSWNAHTFEHSPEQEIQTVWEKLPITLPTGSGRCVCQVFHCYSSGIRLLCQQTGCLKDHPPTRKSIASCWSKNCQSWEQHSSGTEPWAHRSSGIFNIKTLTTNLQLFEIFYVPVMMIWNLYKLFLQEIRFSSYQIYSEFFVGEGIVSFFMLYSVFHFVSFKRSLLPMDEFLLLELFVLEMIRSR